MTPQQAVVPEAGPAPLLGPVLVTEPAAIPAKVLQFPGAAVRAADPAVLPAGVPALTRAALLAEFFIFFGAVPLLLQLRICASLPQLPLLWIAAAYVLFRLQRDPTFDRRELWSTAPVRRQLPQIVALFAAGVVVISALVCVYAPGLFLALPRMHPRLWLAVVITYPMVSVYPQGLVFRTWILHRYRPLLQPDRGGEPKLLILASAAAFAAMHIIFHNWIAVALTFPGGVLFARHYLNSKSLVVSSIEHALYGCFLFTIGLGPFFGLTIH